MLNSTKIINEVIITFEGYWYLFAVQFALCVDRLQNMNKHFVIVEFDEDKSSGIVPKLWLSDLGGDQYDCLWPPYRDPVRQNKAVRNEEQPGPQWAKHRCRMIKEFG